MTTTSLLKISLLVATGAFALPAAQAVQFIEANGQVVIEAEHYSARVDDGQNHPFVLVPNEALYTAGGTNELFMNARGGQFLQVQPDDGANKGNDVTKVGSAPYLEYNVKISTVGEYQLYLRVLGWDGSSDSLYAEILKDGQRLPAPNVGWYRYGGFMPYALPLDFAQLRNNPLDPTPVGWTGYAAPEHVDGTDSDIPALYTIDSPGIYTIRISEREDGTALDALILQLSSMDPPATPGPTESEMEGFIILSDPANVRTVAGVTATFNVHVSNPAGTSYQWQKAAPNSNSFSPINGAVSSSYTTAPLQAADFGSSYRVVVSSGATVLTSRAGRISSGAGQFIEADGQVAIEAEHYTGKADGTTHPFVLVPDAAPFTAGTTSDFLSARGDRFMQVQPDDGLNKGNDVSLVGTAPYLDYTVKISTVGEYQLYLRVLGFDGGSSDSVYAEMLSGGQRLPSPNPGWYRYGGLLPDVLPMDFSQLRNNPLDSTPVGWTGYAAPEHVDGTDSDVPAVFTIDAPGVYTIRISEREDGTCFDSLVLQLSSMDPPPSGGPSESTFEPAGGNPVPAPMLSLERSGKQLTITWVNGGNLEEAPTVTGAWKQIAPSSPFQTTATETARFYRVVR